MKPTNLISQAKHLNESEEKIFRPEASNKTPEDYFSGTFNYTKFSPLFDLKIKFQFQQTNFHFS